MKTNKYTGFTLAEVLITLGIIGIVAAMTIPTLIANTRSQQYRSQFKKTLSTLNQAARMAQAQYDFDFSDIAATGTGDMASNCGNDDPNIDKTVCALLNGTLAGATFLEQTYPDVTLSHGFASDYLIYSMSDGTYILIFRRDNDLFMHDCTKPLAKNIEELLENDAGIDSDGLYVSGLKQCIGFIDVNGKSKPNKEVKCVSDNTVYNPTIPCTVDNASMGDIFPVVFHDGTVEPATNAAAYVLQTTK